MKFGMNKAEFKAKLQRKLNESDNDLSICGFVNKNGDIYPLGTDTKVLSTLFELFVRPIIGELAEEEGWIIEEPGVQNHYPDFTLTDPKSAPPNRIAIDVKTTYTERTTDKFGYTLGGYTSFIRNPTKNIVYPFYEYSSHWVIGFVYTRVATRKAADHHIYNISEVDQIPLSYKEVDWFVAEKWEIAGTSAGSGNTTNIGSISGRIEDFKNITPRFRDEAEFLDYWRNYGRTASDRNSLYCNLDGYRGWRRNNNGS